MNGSPAEAIGVAFASSQMTVRPPPVHSTIWVAPARAAASAMVRACALECTAAVNIWLRSAAINRHTVRWRQRAEVLEDLWTDHFMELA